MLLEEGDEDGLAEVDEELERLEKLVDELEFRRMFSGEADGYNCYLDIQAGSGGTEAQDWGNMLLRMYLRWAEKRGFGVDVVEVSEGEVAGIKSATIHIQGEYAYGWLRTESGVHRFLFLLKLMTMLILKSIHQVFVSTHIGRREREVNMSIKPILLYGLLMNQAEL